MHFSKLIAGLSHADAPLCNDPEIWSLCEDSRLAKQKCLFLARVGTKSDGRVYITEAIAAGACAIVAARGTVLPEGIPPSVAIAFVDDPAIAAGIIAERFHGNPARALHVVGVTGTNGKTTTSYLLQQLLTKGSRRCGLIGTVETHDGITRTPSSLTTPPAFELSNLFARMLDNGCAAVAMEVSSHSLDQHRVGAVAFKTALFTNLTGDHLDYHGSMEKYAAAKAMLFSMLTAEGTAIVNMDDAWSGVMIDAARARGARIWRTSLMDRNAEFSAEIRSMSATGMDVTLRGSGLSWGLSRGLSRGDGMPREESLRLPLVGRHNAMNALQALAAAISVGVPLAEVLLALTRCEAPPGRLQPVLTGSAGFSVLVDYAHSDDALANVLRTLRETLAPGGRLRVVFGCGGDRDRTKRPRMAKVACEGADDVVITSDNPRTEDPQAIIAEVKTGVPADSRANVVVEVDRSKAIAYAVSTAREGDVVLIAGKGHEDYQIIGTQKFSFDDRKKAEEALRERSQATR
ncbi:MAG: UDP-N-acetylmuramoyl-L-alanyl-D-glutamate--2,6-diaminopimelate ligase [Phycisphaerales bacterium]|nr:UDP-N-acetylmuramoyl-L-alanyl-D-glutamate--2,6-diaminopimelate ligase [Phycisphaerales bacterium]